MLAAERTLILAKWGKTTGLLFLSTLTELPQPAVCSASASLPPPVSPLSFPPSPLLTMRLAIPAILLSAVPWILLGVVSVLSRPELEQRPLFRPPSDTAIAERASLVSEDTYGRLERFAMYSSAVYQVLCPYPLGNTLVQSVSKLKLCSCSYDPLCRPSSSSFLYIITITITIVIMIRESRCGISDCVGRLFFFSPDVVLEYTHAYAWVCRARRWAGRDRRCVSGEPRARGYGHWYVVPIM